MEKIIRRKSRQIMVGKVAVEAMPDFGSVYDQYAELQWLSNR